MKHRGIIIYLLALSLLFSACAASGLNHTGGDTGPALQESADTQPSTQYVENTLPAYNDALAWSDTVEDVVGTWVYSCCVDKSGKENTYLDAEECDTQPMAVLRFEADGSGWLTRANGEQFSITWQLQEEDQNDYLLIVTSWFSFQYVINSSNPEYREVLHQESGDIYSIFEKVAGPDGLRGVAFKPEGSGAVIQDDAVYGTEDIIVGSYTFREFSVSVNGEFISGVTLYSCQAGVTDVQIPGEVNGLPVVAISNDTYTGIFEDPIAIQSVQIPDTVCYIGHYAFMNCRNLTDLSVPAGVKYIGMRAFFDCPGLKKLQITADMTLAFQALANAIGLKDISIEQGFDNKEGEYLSFDNCINLREIYLPDSVTSPVSFSGCKALTDIRISSGMSVLSWTYMLMGTPAEILDLPEGFTTLTNGTLDYSSVKSIVLPSTLEAAYYGVFYNCPLERIFFRGTQDQCPASLSSEAGSIPIYYYSETEPAEKGVYWRYVDGEPVIWDTDNGTGGGTAGTQYVEVTAPAEYSWGNEPLNLPTLPTDENVTVNGDLYTYGPYTFLLTLVVDYEGMYYGMELYSCDKSIEVAEIPSEILGCPVVTIGSWNVTDAPGFSGCSSLREVIIPDTVTRIADDAFKDCVSLESVNIPDGVIEIENYAFENCTSLTEITIPESVERISCNAFSNCTSLTELTIPESVLYIFSYAFEYCPGLKELRITPEMFIAGNALDNAIGLETLIVEDGVEEMPDLYNCTSLKEIYIPDSVTSVGIFEGCTSLTRVRLSGGVSKYSTEDEEPLFQNTAVTFVEVAEGVKKLGSHIFGNETLESIILPSTLTEIGEDIFWSYSYYTSYGGELSPAPLREVFFRGTEEQCLQELKDQVAEVGAIIYYLSETEPTEVGNFWHYVDGEPVIW